MNSKIKEIYYAQEIRFPIIGMVIDGNIDGMILFNDEITPTHVFIVHKFGFCQEIFTEYDQHFLVEQIIPFIQKSQEKLRLYNPQGKLADCLEHMSTATGTKRLHYLYEGKYNNRIEDINYTIRPMTIEDFGIELSSRYYKGAEAFIANAMPFVAVSKENEYMAIIYIAGNDGDMCEIDIFTKEPYRRQGIAERLVNRFIFECYKNGKIPTWDCYANLQQSKRLAEKCGFILKREYDFYNIKQ